MPTNEQRREAAKRKLERQLERRAQRARRQKQLTIAGSILAVVLLIAGVALIYTLTKGDDSGTDKSAASAKSPTTSDPMAGMPTARAKPVADTVSCKYDEAPEPAARKATLPQADGVKTSPAKVNFDMNTDRGDIGLTLDNSLSPCTVNSFISLAKQNFFDNTVCHRLTTADPLKVLQCGDPTGTGRGGPGYQYANEFPTDQFSPDDPAAQNPVVYKRGTLAMANAGPGTNGSQFFLVYGDSQLPPQYTVFGTINATGLQTLDKIAAAGVAPGSQQGDGAPAVPVKVESIKAA